MNNAVKMRGQGHGRVRTAPVGGELRMSGGTMKLALCDPC